MCGSLLSCTASTPPSPVWGESCWVVQTLLIIKGEYVRDLLSPLPLKWEPKVTQVLPAHSTRGLGGYCLSGSSDRNACSVTCRILGSGRWQRWHPEAHPLAWWGHIICPPKASVSLLRPLCEKEKVPPPGRCSALPAHLIFISSNFAKLFLFLLIFWSFFWNVYAQNSIICK